MWRGHLSLSGLLVVSLLGLVAGPLEEGGAATVVFQQGVDGYSGTVDTYLREYSPSSIYGGVSVVEWDGEDNGGENFSPLRIDARSRPVEGLRLYSNIHYDFSEEDQGLRFANFGANIDVTDRWAAYVGHTYEKDVDNFGTYSLAYRLTPKWTVVASHDRSWKDAQSLEERLELVRDFHAFDLSIVVENDERADEQSVSVRFSPKAIKMPPRPGSFVRNLAEARDYDE